MLKFHTSIKLSFIKQRLNLRKNISFSALKTFSKENGNKNKT